MTESIVAIILYLSTILGGVPADAGQSGKDKSNEKEKTETPIKANGGSGTWQDGKK